MLAQRNRMCVRSNGGDKLATRPPIRGKGENRLDLRVVWEILGIVERHRTATRVQFVVALIRGLHSVGDAMRIGPKEIRSIHQQTAVLLRFNLESPQDKLGK